ncbi:sensor histidine kinase [Dactylosporangium siamense]|uniref:histidine kinase n=1 Tax=Dactylosporangium siamense TaxID=685454 RepID=A0A919PSR4_9ACTN|nr:HAMP domain-containing sensor histidine kinase [Dactylosporangium siamense]GIG47738.1 putative sensor histidine kinase PhoR [Dactylosporangium siamense]
MKPRPWRQWTVRTRIVVSVVTLAGVALIAANAIGVTLLNWYLMQRIDDQLVHSARPPGIVNPNRTPNPNPFATSGPRPSASPSASAGTRRDGFPRDRGEFFPGPLYQIYRFDGTGKLLNPEPVALDPALFGDLKQRAAQPTPFTVTTPSGDDWRAIVFPTDFGGNAGYGANAVALGDVQDTRDQMLQYSLLVSLILLGFVGLATATLVRVGLSPLTRMEDTAVEIAGGNLSSRIVDADPHTESGRLGIALNTMLTRIEEAVDDSAESEQRLRQFLADAAHELRTPLTSVQGFAELYRRGGAPPGPALDEAMECIEAEVSRMRLLVNDLLTLARMDEERPLQLSPVDLLAVAADSVRDAHVRVPTRFVQLSALDERSVTFEPVTVEGDETRIRQVVANLVSNALQHTPEDTRVVVRVGRATDTGPPPTAVIGEPLPDGVPLAAIEVSDTGPGMKPGDAVRVFERLYRAEGSRSRRHGGAGLGLAIVAAIVQAHGGRVELWTAPGEGARFRVLLPALSEPDFEDDSDEPGFRGNSEGS